MKNSIFSRVKLLTGVMFVASLLMLTGCFNPSKPETPSLPEGVTSLSADDTLVGTWESSYGEIFKISDSNFICEGTYEGNNLVVRKLSDSKGYIYVKYTVVYDWAKGQMEEPEDKTGWLNSWGMWYPLNKDLIGKWYGIYYTNLTPTSMTISGALGTKLSTDTLEEAITEFTFENGYFGGNSELTKKSE